jgi:hypothetical protein
MTDQVMGHQLDEATPIVSHTQGQNTAILRRRLPHITDNT